MDEIKDTEEDLHEKINFVCSAYLYDELFKYVRVLVR